MSKRREFLKQAGALSSLSLLPANHFWNAFFQANYQFKALRDDVYIFTERGGTIACYMSKDGLAVVDTQFPDQAQHLIDELKKNNAEGVDLLVNTHHHGDHTAGNIAFKGMVKNVLAHENSMLNQKRVAEGRGGLENQLLPTTTYKSGKISEKVGSEKITLHYFGSAHTNGDSFVHFENANIVHTGDLLFNRRVPFIDKSSGANVMNWIEVMEKGYKAFDDDTLFVFGHSGNGFEITGTREDLKAFQNYLTKVIDFVKQGKAQGRTQEELGKAEEVPGAPEWKGTQTRAVNAVWMELYG
jgi:cyclase